MINPAFLVDGFTEKLLIEKICSGKKINRIGCNGNAVTMSAMAKRIASLIRLMNNRYYPIVILIDRETRVETCDEIQAALEKELQEAGIKEDIRVGICDRMIENWILADWESFIYNAKVERVPKKPNGIEGAKGKSLIKSFLPAYQETTNGVQLLYQANPESIYDNSRSFRCFVDKLKDIGCPWLNNIFVTAIQ
jgi:hypothetical protein